MSFPKITDFESKRRMLQYNGMDRGMLPPALQHQAVEQMQGESPRRETLKTRG